MPSRKKQNDKTYTYYNLVNTIRGPKGPRHQVVLSLGKLENVPPGEIKLLGRLIDQRLTGTFSLLPHASGRLASEAERIAGLVIEKRARGLRKGGSIRVDPESIQSSEATLLGPVYVGYAFWKKLGMEKSLADCGLSEKQRRLACVEVIARLVFPGSERSTAAWLNRTALATMLHDTLAYVNKDSLYRVSDLLWRKRLVIESSLAGIERSLFHLEECVLLYDLTSTYFEGLCESNPKAERGYSRDHRPDCKQVVVGMVLDGEGFPKATEVYKGNTHDSTTLEAMLSALEGRIGMRKGLTVVMDRGIATEENLRKLKGAGYHYIAATRSEARDEWIGVVQSKDFIHLDAASRDHPGVDVCIRRAADEVWLFVRSEARVKKDEAIRERFVSRMREALGRLAHQVENGRLKSAQKIQRKIGRIQERNKRASRFFTIDLELQEGKARMLWSLDEKKLEQAELLDGCYVLKTDRTDLDQRALWTLYSMLTRVERSFRYLKTSLGLRPNFHQLEMRVEGHIFISVLAYHLLHAIEQVLLSRGDHRSWPAIKQELETHRVLTIQLPDAEGKVHHLRLATNPTALQKDIYEKLGLDSKPLPPKRYVFAEKEK